MWRHAERPASAGRGAPVLRASRPLTLPGPRAPAAAQAARRRARRVEDRRGLLQHVRRRVGPSARLGTGSLQGGKTGAGGRAAEGKGGGCSAEGARSGRPLTPHRIRLRTINLIATADAAGLRDPGVLAAVSPAARPGLGPRCAPREVGGRGLL